MKEARRNFWKVFLALALVVLVLTGCASLKGKPTTSLQVIPEETAISPGLIKKPIKFKGWGFASKEMVVVNLVVPQDVKVKGLAEGENEVGVAYGTADEQGHFEAAMQPLTTLSTLIQVGWVVKEAGMKPDFAQATPFPPRSYAIRASGIDSGREATAILTILPPAKKE